jgi:hypothetical protein
MISKVSIVKIALIALSTAGLIGPAQAQQGKGTLYAYHSPPVVGGCPGLDWHVTLEPDNKLVGFVAWDNGKHMARLEGNLNKDRSFSMDAQEVGGQNRKATAKGTAGGGIINIQIGGSGTPCDGVNLPIPTVSGGYGGGGG